MNKKAKLLWLSDFHHREIMSTKRAEIRKSLFKSIKNKAKNLDYTHLVLTGDIAFSGKNDQYEKIWDDLIRELSENKRLISIPGNHDLDREFIWKNKDKLRNYIKVGNNDTYRRSESSINKLKGAFSSYTKFYNERIKEHSGNNGLTYFQKNTGGLYGIIADKEYNINFICFNSAWFAWGSDTFEGLASQDAIIDKGNYFSGEKIKDKDYINNLLGVIDYGNLAIPEAESLRSFQLDNEDIFNDYLNIGLIHHPFNWLSWNTNYVGGASDFADLISNLDIVLTSHVHVPHYPPTRYRGKPLVYESPQIWDYHFESSSFDGVSQDKTFIGYSLLDINYKGDKVLSKGFSYSVKQNSAQTSLFKLNPNIKTFSSSEKLSRKIPYKVSLLEVAKFENPVSWICNMFTLDKVKRKTKLSLEELTCSYLLKRFGSQSLDESKDDYYIFSEGNLLKIGFKSKDITNNHIEKSLEFINSTSTLDVCVIVFDFQIHDLLSLKGLLTSSYGDNLEAFENYFSTLKVNYVNKKRKKGVFNEEMIINFTIIEFVNYQDLLHLRSK